MSLLEEARAIPSRPRGNPCQVVIECQAHPDLADQILEAIYSVEQTVKVANVFRKRHIDIAALTIGRHRRIPCTHCAHHGISR